MDIYIKNMVCDRCIMIVEQILRQVGLACTRVELGVASVKGTPSEFTMAQLGEKLHTMGFELLDDHREQTIEQLRTAIISWVRHNPEHSHTTLSACLAYQLHTSYSSLSKLFSEHTGQTIEQYCILQRVEFAKELITYGELGLKAIAFRLGYSSAAHLSSQFKAVTGLTPTQYKNKKGNKRVPIDKIVSSHETVRQTITGMGGL